MTPPCASYNEEHPYGIELQDIAPRYASARLLVVGTGAQMLSPAGKLFTWTGIFGQWRERVLFTPKPTASWGRSEQRIEEIFTILPASLQSLAFWVEELDSGEDARFDEWRKQVKDAYRQPVQPDLDNPLLALIRHYDYPLLRWIAASAIYPVLHYDLTVWLGRQLDGDNSPSPITNFDNLLSLFRLPWFVEGQMPRKAREQLLAWLERNDPQRLLSLRRQLAELLRQNSPLPHSAAWNGHQLTIALNEWLTEKDPAKKRALQKQIADYLQAGLEADFTMLKYLDKLVRSPFRYHKIGKNMSIAKGSGALAGRPSGKTCCGYCRYWSPAGPPFSSLTRLRSLPVSSRLNTKQGMGK